jgi:hypothetical protein
LSSSVPERASPKPRKLQRLDKLKQGLLSGKTLQEIAEECGVGIATIHRDLKAWRDSGGFELWLTEEFYRLHGQVKGTDPTTAYREISNLLGRTITQRQKVEGELKGGVLLVKGWDLGADHKPDKAGPDGKPAVSTS